MNSTTQIHKIPNIKPIANMETKCLIPRAKPKAPNFNDLLLETIDSAFSKLGCSSQQILYQCVEKRYGVKREDIPNNIATFAHALEEIFGQAAYLLETKIMQAMHSKVPYFKYIPKEELAFVDYIENLNFFLQRPPHF
jgi:hypothetical protein